MKRRRNIENDARIFYGLPIVFVLQTKITLRLHCSFWGFLRRTEGLEERLECDGDDDLTGGGFQIHIVFAQAFIEALGRTAGNNRS